ncbi:MAG: spermidine/putrescine ABC transporter substrate-binding protein, partial [Pseudomonas sp.]|nr:spermidine/putrescine ABC transporter substrate-binding protein [Pseudomonas sp.]
MKLPASLLAVALAACAHAQAGAAPKQVNLYIWSEYLAPDTLASFEEKTGIRVVVDHFDSLETV